MFYFSDPFFSLTVHKEAIKNCFCEFRLLFLVNLLPFFRSVARFFFCKGFKISKNIGHHGWPTKEIIGLWTSSNSQIRHSFNDFTHSKLLPLKSIFHHITPRTFRLGESLKIAQVYFYWQT